MPHNWFGPSNMIIQANSRISEVDSAGCTIWCSGGILVDWWIRFGTSKMVPARRGCDKISLQVGLVCLVGESVLEQDGSGTGRGGRINSFGKRFSFSAVLLSNVFAEIDEFEWILTSEIPQASFLREYLFTGLLSSMCWASFAEVGTQDELIENIHVWHHIPKILC